MKIRSVACGVFPLIFLLFGGVLNAQMVGPDCYIKGLNTEIGFDGAGGYEGCNTTVSAPLAGMHFRSGTSYFGFVANPQLDGWANFNGDFFCPGSPENGWGIQIGSSTTMLANNNCAGFPQTMMNGAITNYSHIGSCYLTDWAGTMTTGGTNLGIKISYLLTDPDLYYTTTVSIKNNTSATIPEIYYHRNVDPDNNEPISFSFSTTNTVISEPTGTCGLAHVCATQPASPGVDSSYLGFAAVGANFRVCYGGFSNRNAYDLWTGGVTGTGTFIQTVGVPDVNDEAISLSYKIVNLAPGATETFKFVTILDAAAANNAINNLLYLSYVGSASAPPSVCSPYTDTVNTCGGPVPIAISGSIVNDFTWSWSPTAGLSSTTGPSITANPTSTTLYTATGTPISGCLSPVTMQVWVQVTPADGLNPYITPVPPVCLGDPPFNFVVDSTGGVWTGTGITNTTTGTFSPTVAGPGTQLITYTTPGLCNTTDTVLITVIGAASATITQPPLVCMGDSITIVAASSGGVWSGTGITNSSTGLFNSNASGTGSFVVTYTLTSGVCTSTDTATVQVGAVVTPVTAFHYITPVCKSDPVNPTAIDTTGFTSGGTFTSSPLGLTLNSSTGAITLSSSSPGTYSVTYSVPATVCGPAGTTTTTIKINPVIMPVTAFSYTTPVCIYDPNPTPITGGTWTTGGTFTAPAGVSINDSTGMIDLANTTPGTYTITYSVTGSTVLCTGSGTSTTSIVIHPRPTILTNPDVTMYLGATAWIYASGGTGYVWTPSTSLSCATCDSSAAAPTESTTYCVQVTDLGCTDTACVKVNIEIPCPTNRNLVVPNAFTPNGDGQNDELCLGGWGDCISGFKIYIYDRWGEKVFESGDPAFCWDGIYKGKLLDPGVFVYFIKATYITAGETIADPTSTIDVNKKGNISLIR